MHQCPSAVESSPYKALRERRKILLSGVSHAPFLKISNVPIPAVDFQRLTLCQICDIRHLAVGSISHAAIDGGGSTPNAVLQCIAGVIEILAASLAQRSQRKQNGVFPNWQSGFVQLLLANISVTDDICISNDHF